MLGLIIKAGYCVMVLAALFECSPRTARNAPIRESRADYSGNADNQMENTEADKQVKLAASFNAKAASLEVEYKVRNTTDKPIYVFNVILDTDKIEMVSPFKFYSCLRDDGTVVLAKAIPKLPAITSVEVRDIPYTTKIEPGKEFAEKVEVPLPLEEYSPYFQKDHNSKTEERTAERIYLVLQYVQEQDGLEIKETNIPNAFKVRHPELFTKVQTLKSDVRPVEIKVNRRLDTFERF